MRDAERDAFETIEAESRLHDMPEEAAIVNDNMNAEERDILDRFERGELRSAPGVEREIDVARRAAPQHVQQDQESESAGYRARLQSRPLARQGRGNAYQTLLSSVIHKYLSGRLAEKR